MRFSTVAIIAVLLCLILSGCEQDAATPTRQPEPTDTKTSEPTPRATPTLIPTPAVETATKVSQPAEEVEDVSEEENLERQFPPAAVINDEGGPVSITGVITYTNPFFTLGVAEPVVILEDQAGFVDRDRSFLMPLASQTLGQITSDFLSSPFSYSVALPIEPQGTYRDIDLDDEDEQGVQVYAVAYWNNIFGDPFLEERDLSGGGWSTAYASTRISDEAETDREIVGGKLLIFALDDQQGFPSGFGEDGLLFSEDDPIVQIPQGYSVVDLDSDPFTFDRSRDQVIDLIEPEGTALVDYSDLSYTEAFDDLVDQLRDEYAFSEYKNIDWDALHAEFRTRFEQAELSRSLTAYRRALRDFSWAIPDGHVSGPQLIEDLQQFALGSLGFSMAELDDGRIVVESLIEGSPSDEAGIEQGAEIFSFNGIEIQQVIEDTIPYTAPFSTAHVERLERIRFASRFPVGETVEVSFQNPGGAPQTLSATTVVELDTLFSAPFEEDLNGFEQPIEYDLLDPSGYGYVKIYSFSDNDLLTVQLWERLMGDLNEVSAPGLIIDLRQNSGGRGFLADQMAAYVFQEPLVLGNSGFWDDDREEFHFDTELEQRFYLPAEELRYDGEIVVIVGPSCASACEFFAYDLTLNDRATIIGLYPTAGLGGSIARVKMPENEFFTFTQGRAVDNEGNIHIEGVGVVPEITLPVNEETLFDPGDVVLDAAIDVLNSDFFGDILEGEQVSIGDTIEASLEPGMKVRYLLEMDTGEVLSIFLESDDFEPVFALYDDSETLLGSTEGLPEASATNVEVPFAFTLIIEVYAANESEGGNYILSIVDES